jgi:hypothetical protein
MSTALAARKHRSQKGSRDDDLEDILSSDEEEKVRDRQKTNGARRIVRRTSGRFSARQ